MSRSFTFSSSLLAREWRALLMAAAQFVVFAVVAVTATLVIDSWYRSVPLTQMDRRMIDFRNRAADIEVLVLGNSQMCFGVDPQYVGKHAFNLAAPSQDLYYDSRVIERFVDELPRLRTVFWGVAPFSFSYDIGRLPGERRREALYDRYFERRGKRCNWRCWLERHFEMLRVRGDDPIASFLTLWRAPGKTDFRSKTPNADGFMPRKPVKERDDGLARARFHTKLFRKRIRAENYGYVVEAISLLKERGVRVVFVRPPSAKSYRRGFPSSLLQGFERVMKRLQHDYGVEFVDLSDAVPFGKGYFRNSDHVQGKGTVMFSNRLGQIHRRGRR